MPGYVRCWARVGSQGTCALLWLGPRVQQKPFLSRKGPFSPRKGWKEPGEGVAGVASSEG